MEGGGLIRGEGAGWRHVVLGGGGARAEPFPGPAAAETVCTLYVITLYGVHTECTLHGVHSVR